MSATPDNPPAFPCQSYEYDLGIKVPVFQFGMTLRDWFAGQAAAADSCDMLKGFSRENPHTFLADRAKLYYRIADAMLAERAK